LNRKRSAVVISGNVGRLQAVFWERVVERAIGVVAGERKVAVGGPGHHAFSVVLHRHRMTERKFPVNTVVCLPSLENEESRSPGAA